MYCPKCQQTFEEGSRRFCPTDGARLVSELNEAASGGIFANLIRQMDTISEIDKPVAAPTTEITDPSMQFTDKADPKEDELFFELDDDGIGQPMNEASFAEASRAFQRVPPAERSSTFLSGTARRKVSPYEISDGGVNLDQERPDIFTGDLDVTDPESFVDSTVKGRYRVTEFLGGDESGLAYIGQDKITDRKVLVRIILRKETDEIMAAILAEERVSLAHLSHPNIARLIDSGTFTNGIEFLISEYVDSLSVRDILDIHGRFTQERAGRIVRQAASALAQAHQEGILHRDVRPENLILDTEAESEQLVLVNFGASNGEPTEVNAVYKAPEVLDGRIATAASDIYSLAVVSYEMLTGRLPFEGGSTREIIRSQYSGVSLQPSDVVGELTPAIDEVLEKAFTFNSSERYTKAREFGDAFYSAVCGSPAKAKTDRLSTAAASTGVRAVDNPRSETLEPLITPVSKGEPAWKARSPEPPEVEEAGKRTAWLIGILILVGLLAAGWWYISSHPVEPPAPGVASASPVNGAPLNTISPSAEMPPLPRNIPQPANTNYFQSTKQNLRGDLLANFVGFTLYYPKDWKLNGPSPGVAGQTRGKFLDISRNTPDGRMMEQMLISYYPSKGTFTEDAERFPLLVKETNDTLKKILPGYQDLSEGEIKVNGDWRAYEVKFQGGGTSPGGEKLVVWGRRIFIPASRPGARDGFEITMLATSLADDIKGVEDVGVKGELGAILYTFEPSQNF